MKSSTQDKSSVISGIAILILAAVFSISLLLQLLGFSSYAGNSNPLFKLGTVLYSVYGFSSILIPAFLIIAGLSCFTSSWSARKAFRLLTAVIPFFTSVLCENICRTIYKDSESGFAAVKISIMLVTGIMLIIIEILTAGVIADKINRNTKLRKTEEKDESLNLKSDFETKINSIINSDKASKPKLQEEKEEKIEINPVFDKAFEEKKSDLIDEPSSNEILEEEILDENEPEQEKEAEEEEEQKPLLSDEEYAALTQPEPEDELEWNNLPPAPDTLPPEYDSDYADSEPENDDISEEKETVPGKDAAFSEFSVTEAVVDKTADNDTPFSDAAAISSMVNRSTESSMSSSSPSPYDSQITLEYDESESEIDITEETDKESEYEPVQSKYGSKIDLTVDDNEVMEDQIIDDAFLEMPEPIIDDDEEIDIPKTEPLEEEPVYKRRRLAYPEPSFEDEPETPKENNIFSVASNVFSDMDKDIREEHGFSDSSVDSNIIDDIIDNEDDEDDEDDDIFPGDIINDTPDTTDKVTDYIMFEGSRIPVEKKHIEKPSTGATNLTPDELTDFFTAQQKENTPKTKTIEGNLPPKNSSRARKKGAYVIPSDLLTAYENDQYWIIDEGTKTAAVDLKNTLAEFNIEADVTGIKKGPVVTMFEILPAPGVKLSKIVALQDNIALSLAASSVRIVAPIPGKQAVGIEIPNRHRSIVGFRELIEQNLEEFKKMSIPVVLGKDILGKAQIMDLVKTPHLLIAGATGAGKSVCVNSIILSILYKRPADKVKLILVDPKVVELKLYNNIPHLLTPVITEPKKAFQALQYCLCEMERRYSMLDNMGVRDISSYNSRIEERHLAMEKLPYIVVIIDEFADLMATTGKELESTVARLTAMSRAVGIHLVLATQRPSVNVITGLIKANIPSRIAFMVASRTDSSIIIDSPGAEKLLGRGDMLYASAVDPNPVRIQGTFVSDEEVEAVVDYVKQFGEPDYIDDQIFVEDDDEQGDLFGNDVDFGEDPLYDEALQIVVQSGKASASYIQRRLKIGYNRAARLVEEMEERGIVGPPNGSKPREIIHIP